MVGNPSVLSADPHWGALLHTALENNAYRGCDLSPELREVVSTVLPRLKVPLDHIEEGPSPVAPLSCVIVA